MDGKKVDIPSYKVKPGQAVQVCEKSRNLLSIKESLEFAESRGVPTWIERDIESMVGKMLRLPERDELALPVQEQLIVELYTR